VTSFITLLRPDVVLAQTDPARQALFQPFPDALCPLGARRATEQMIA
jgi:hypothetical protein